MGRDPAAAFHRLVHDRNGAAIAQFYGEGKGLALPKRGAQIRVVAPRIKWKCAGGDACLEQVSNCTSTPNVKRVDIVEFSVSLVPDDKLVLCVEHAQTLIHIIERNIELQVLLAQPLADAPSRQRSNETDTEAAYNGRQCEGNRAGRS
ncbi:MAG: hypothetical protein WBG10_15080 [Pseudolabrys sp.]